MRFLTEDRCQLLPRGGRIPRPLRALAISLRVFAPAFDARNRNVCFIAGSASSVSRDGARFSALHLAAARSLRLNKLLRRLSDDWSTPGGATVDSRGRG